MSQSWLPADCYDHLHDRTCQAQSLKGWWQEWHGGQPHRTRGLVGLTAASITFPLSFLFFLPPSRCLGRNWLVGKGTTT